MAASEYLLVLNEEVTNTIQGEGRVIAVDEEPTDLGAVGLWNAMDEGRCGPVVRQVLPRLEIPCPGAIL